MKWILPLILLIFFEFVADVFAKQWSLDRKSYLAIASLAAYLIANTFWLFALANGSGLARGAVLFSVASAVIAIALGVLLYHEKVYKYEMIGLVLGVVSIALMMWND